MAALRIRTPTLQTLLTTRAIPTIPRRAFHPQPFNNTFSTTHIARNTSTSTNANANANANANGTSTFSLKTLVPNPRTRQAVIAGLVLMTGVETYMFVQYWPRIKGWVGFGEGRKQ
ncbi:uncharacterized protein C8A04DRAFT_27048 [Dichotomopilus funicola]|uniref:Uncharacterized protein n=1 Tax=Dichotomopilus funicola TaxID=1934379 RepID=A0AAN6V5K5_9PEZI|nr:hypothetical protein C8A04DRAFT_27048 [Dichotomopilus funicola]